MKTLRELLLVLKVGLLAAPFVICAAASAQDYPNKTIKFLVPYGASGGGPDFFARVVGEKIRTLSGQTVVVDNRPGAAGLLGTSLAAKATPDGYTVLVGDTGPLSIAPNFRKEIASDPEKDFIPVSNGITAPLFLVVNTNLGVNNVRELVALLKSKPDLPYGSTGVGSVHHLAMGKFLFMTGTKMTHIPYLTQAQSVPALLSGEISVLVVAYPNVKAHIASGRLKALAVASSTRVPFAHDIPTLAESGLRNFDVGIDVGLLVPAGTPPSAVQKLNSLVQFALKSPEVVEKLNGAGLIPIPSTPVAYGQKIKKDRGVFKAIVADTGIKPE